MNNKELLLIISSIIIGCLIITGAIIYTNIETTDNEDNMHNNTTTNKTNIDNITDNTSIQSTNQEDIKSEQTTQQSSSDSTNQITQGNSKESYEKSQQQENDPDYSGQAGRVLEKGEVFENPNGGYCRYEGNGEFVNI